MNRLHACLWIDTAVELALGERAASVPEAPPEAPTADPDTYPDTPAAPPERKPDLDPFNPDWPPGRQEPQPKA